MSMTLEFQGFKVFLMKINNILFEYTLHYVCTEYMYLLYFSRYDTYDGCAI